MISEHMTMTLLSVFNLVSIMSGPNGSSRPLPPLPLEASDREELDPLSDTQEEKRSVQYGEITIVARSPL